MYSASIFEHQKHLREVLGRLQSAGFTLNKKKVVLGVSEIKYLGHYLSSRGIRVIPDRVEAIKQYPCLKSLCCVRRFLEWSLFRTIYLRLFKTIRTNALTKKKGDTLCVGRRAISGV